MNGATAFARTHSFYQSFITHSVIRKPDLPMTPLRIDVFAVRQWPGNGADLDFRGVLQGCTAAIVAAAQTVVPAAAARRRPVVSKRLVLVLPAEDLRSRQLHISTAELAGCCRARLPRCAPAGTEPPVASAHSSLRDLRVLKAGWVSSRLLFGRSLCGQLLCSRLLCSRLLCSDEAKVRWVGARSLRVRLGCFTNLHRQSTGNAVPRIMWTLELQRWPHIWDACGPAP